MSIGLWVDPEYRGRGIGSAKQQVAVCMLLLMHACTMGLHSAASVGYKPEGFACSEVIVNVRRHLQLVLLVCIPDFVAATRS